MTCDFLCDVMCSIGVVYLIIFCAYTMKQVKEVLLKKHAEQVERVKKQATRFAVANALTRVIRNYEYSSPNLVALNSTMKSC